MGEIWLAPNMGPLAWPGLVPTDALSVVIGH